MIEYSQINRKRKKSFKNEIKVTILVNQINKKRYSNKNNLKYIILYNKESLKAIGIKLNMGSFKSKNKHKVVIYMEMVKTNIKR